MKKATNREILRKQLELLAKESPKCMPHELAEYSESMVEIYRELSKAHPFGITIIQCILVNLSFSLFKKLVNFFRRHGR